MNKKLIIILYKISICGLSKTAAQSYLSEIMNACNLSKDDELKESYIIRELYVPILNGDSDVKVIYPVSNTTNDLQQVIDIINKIIKENPESNNEYWFKLLRELKLRKLDNE